VGCHPAPDESHCGWVELWLLGQVADHHAFGAGDSPARFGGVLPGDEFEQRGFPGPVRPDQADLLVVLDFPGKVAEECFGSQDEGEIGQADGYHGYSVRMMSLRGAAELRQGNLIADANADLLTRRDCIAPYGRSQCHH